MLSVISFNARGTDGKDRRRFTDILFDEFKFNFVLVQEYSSSQQVPNAINDHVVFCMPSIGGSRQPAILIHRGWRHSVVAGPFGRSRAIAIVVKVPIVGNIFLVSSHLDPNHNLQSYETQ